MSQLSDRLGAAAVEGSTSAPSLPLTILLTAVAFFMVTLDALVVVTALPSIHRSIGGNVSGALSPGQQVVVQRSRSASAWYSRESIVVSGPLASSGCVPFEPDTIAADTDRAS